MNQDNPNKEDEEKLRSNLTKLIDYYKEILDHCRWHERDNLNKGNSLMASSWGNQVSIYSQVVRDFGGLLK